ncbi:hypothetical protein GF323_07190 [Candidatus Woesearchaeota archaeon]|nr:hypothetical protein [Candidatus Woesearchaeota archaeon]
MAKKPTKSAKEQSSSKDEQVGFHKGALSTLAKERDEMLKILKIVEQLMQLHVRSLKDLGIDLEKQAKEAAKDKGGKKKKPKPIEDLLG